MEKEYTTIQVSSNIYWGFQMKIEKDKLLLTPKKDIVLELKKYMKTFFAEHNLMELCEGINNLNLHIHQSLLDPIIFACDHDYIFK